MNKYVQKLAYSAIIALSSITAYTVHQTHQTHKQHAHNLYTEISVIAERAEDQRLKSKVCFYLLHKDYQALQQAYELKCRESDELYKVGQDIIQRTKDQNNQLEARIQALEEKAQIAQE